MLAVCSVMLSCTETKKQISNVQQRNFDNFLISKNRESYNYSNDIQRKEFYKLFEKSLCNYVDSIGLFVNWEGVIDDIKTEESGNTTAVKFKISFLPEEYRNIEFFCTHLVKTDSLSTDYLYNTVKNMPNGLIVYFDGFIRTKNSGEIYYHYGSSNDESNISYPDYEFWPVEIGPEKRKDSLSVNLQNAVSSCYNIIQPLREQYIGLISKEESDKKYNELLPAFENAKGKLTPAEKLYIQRLNGCLIYNFMFGE